MTTASQLNSAIDASVAVSSGVISSPLGNEAYIYPLLPGSRLPPEIRVGLVVEG